MGRKSSAKRVERERLSRDRASQEAERIRLARLVVDGGLDPSVVASVSGFSQSAVYGWAKSLRERGEDGLRAKMGSGRPPKLTEAQQLYVMKLVVDNDPDQLRFEFALWTREMVRELILRRFSVDLSPKSVGRLMRRWGLSPQRPLRRAYEADPAAAERWKTEEYPAIRALASEVGATIFFADEASVRSDYHAGTTWAPVGQTPVVPATGQRFKVNMISAVSPKGGVSFDVFDGNMNAARFIEFCRKLVRDNLGRPVFLIVDNVAYHKAKVVQEYVASTKGQLRLYFLPPYSPQLNPDEWVWKNIKHDRIGKLGIASITTREHLWSRTVQALNRLVSLSDIVRGFFRDPDLAYISGE